MTSNIIYELEINKDMNKCELYDKLIQTFPKIQVEFLMYNMFQYVHNETDEKVKRKDQNSFREELIERYDECVITGMIEEVCEACHIIPFCKCDEKDKYDVNNGLLLRSDLHKLFDKELLKINPYTLQMTISENILSNPKMKEYTELNNKIICIHKNSIDFLKKRYTES